MRDMRSALIKYNILENALNCCVSKSEMRREDINVMSNLFDLYTNQNVKTTIGGCRGSYVL